MMNEQPHKTWIIVIVAIISAAGVIIAAIISLGMPFAERIADRYYPTFTPIVNVNVPVASTLQAVQPTVIIQQPIDATPTTIFTSVPQGIIPTQTDANINVVGNNLVQNSGFETGMYSGGWEWGLPTVSIQNGYNSSSALCSKQELQSNQTVGWVGFHQNVPISENQKYTLSAWVKLQNSSQVHIKILWFDRNFAEIKDNFIMGGTDGTSDWSQHGGVATSPTNSVTARLTFWHGVKVGDINVPNSFMCIDDVFFATIQ